MCTPDPKVLGMEHRLPLAIFLDRLKISIMRRCSLSSLPQLLSSCVPVGVPNNHFCMRASDSSRNVDRNFKHNMQILLQPTNLKWCSMLAESQCLPKVVCFHVRKIRWSRVLRSGGKCSPLAFECFHFLQWKSAGQKRPHSFCANRLCWEMKE